MKKFLNNKNIFLYCTIALLVVFSTFYFVTINKISYAFEVDENSLYEDTIMMIEDTAKMYGESDPTIFGENDYVYITVGELIEKGVLLPDGGKMVDPRNPNKELNDLKIKITNKNGAISADVLN